MVGSSICAKSFVCEIRGPDGLRSSWNDMPIIDKKRIMKWLEAYLKISMPQLHLVDRVLLGSSSCAKSFVCEIRGPDGLKASWNDMPIIGKKRIMKWLEAYLKISMPQLHLVYRVMVGSSSCAKSFVSEIRGPDGLRASWNDMPIIGKKQIMKWLEAYLKYLCLNFTWYIGSC